MKEFAFAHSSKNMLLTALDRNIWSCLVRNTFPTALDRSVWSCLVPALVGGCRETGTLLSTKKRIFPRMCSLWKRWSWGCTTHCEGCCYQVQRKTALLHIPGGWFYSDGPFVSPIISAFIASHSVSLCQPSRKLLPNEYLIKKLLFYFI